MRVARRDPRFVTVSESSKRDIVQQMGVREDRLHIVPVGVDPQIFRPMPEVSRVRGRLMTTASADAPMKGLVPLLEALAKVRTERDDVELVIIGRPKGKSKIPALIQRLGLTGAVRYVSGVTTERIVELYAEAEVAVVPSLYEGFSLPTIEAMACGVPVVATTGGALPEVVGTDGETGLLVPPGDPDALGAGAPPGAGRRRPAGPPRCGRPRPGPRQVHLAGHRDRDGGELPGTPRRASRGRAPLMLTVDFDRLDLRAGQRLLDMGCGGGRHAFAAMRRGATVVALDYDASELKEVRATRGAMIEAGEIAADAPGGEVNGDALRLPFPDATFDRIIASEVLEHLWDDTGAIAELVRVLRPGGRLAVTVPTRFPERVSWAINYRYHDTPGGHVRIYRQHELEAKLEQSGLWLRGSHHAHALHSPYWWLKCTFGLDNTGAWPVRKYHDFLVYQIERQPRWVAALDRSLNPVMGKSLVVYTQKVG